MRNQGGTEWAGGGAAGGCSCVFYTNREALYCSPVLGLLLFLDRWEVGARRTRSLQRAPAQRLLVVRTRARLVPNHAIGSAPLLLAATPGWKLPRPFVAMTSSSLAAVLGRCVTAQPSSACGT